MTHQPTTPLSSSTYSTHFSSALHPWSFHLTPFHPTPVLSVRRNTLLVKVIGGFHKFKILGWVVGFLPGLEK
jgi:energy-converting hydrogenase Eha subunit A